MTILETPPPNMLSYSSTPPISPPPGKPASWTWTCRHCRSTWKLAVTRRCLRCIKTKTVGGSKMIGRSHTSPERRQHSIKKYRGTRPAENHDYDHWTIHNDWRRFRSAYNAAPDEWRRQNKRELAALRGERRRVMKAQIETRRRTDMTQQRLERMLSNTHNCEIDCDYPSQCHSERFEAMMNRPDEVVVGTMSMGIPVYGEDGRNVNKLPLCGLIPEFDQQMTDPEEVNNEDEVLAAYEDDEKDDWFVTSQFSPDSSDEDEDEEEEHDEEPENEHEEKREEGEDDEEEFWGVRLVCA
ncbi:hypothetical protein FVEN_g6137 [Fusarium venenatum]|uniref:Uncharacterized protein n=1 Tax=Fusarium venenatum TaxID=56646 RepID=A0A2L2TV96_9HYPO|nr:uncharacterized protein FVRRES_01962 [Fusarium venenatum]KAG8355960.1 hypothetical protein FVEN_g6137 [Fusarium venenatum]KAH7004897.1 hypothetical protein EDB82DRAFT_520904 [Fusarium venenatum]CEI65450.1 unnamed protein product [Fusarium venenatum]